MYYVSSDTPWYILLQVALQIHHVMMLLMITRQMRPNVVLLMVKVYWMILFTAVMDYSVQVNQSVHLFL